jgi:predicted amidohydrolase YtcJ
VRDIAELQVAIKERATHDPPSTWITAVGYDESRLAERHHPTRWDLDKAAGKHPVRLLHRTGRASVLNSLALSLAGIGRETPDPPSGLIDRDLNTGEPTGLLFQMNSYLEATIPPLASEDIQEGVRLADHLNLSHGITSFQDASVTNDLSQWQTFRRLKERKEVRSRVSVMLGFKYLEEFSTLGLAFRSGDRHLRIGAVKIIVDQTTGQLNPPQEELNRQVLQAHRAGFQVALHAIEDVDLEAAITALEVSRAQEAGSNQRPRLEHCSLCPPPLLERMARLRPTVASQPPFLYFSGDKYLTEVSEHQRPWLYRFRSFWKQGLPLAGSSDSPVAGNNPLLGIYAAVTRRTESGEVVLPRERISALQALKMYTVQSAYAAFDEREKGSLSPGKLADLVVLNADPTRVDKEEIKDLQVEMTIIEGQIVYEI